MSFKKAERKQVKIKIAITGPSGAGKTYSALKIAKGLAQGGKIAVIDTEAGSASLYADLPGMPEYDSIELTPPFLSEKYMKLIDEAVAQKYSVLIIDSISHQWNSEGGIMDRKDKEQLAKPNQNGYTLWAKYTPEHEKFKQKILQSPIHVIATMRSKQDYVMETNDRGKVAPKKVGLAPIQREGSEYDFTTVLDMSTEHFATASKDRTGLFDIQSFKPDEATGKLILNWLIKGKEESVEATGVDALDSFIVGHRELAKMKLLGDAAQMTGSDVMKYIFDRFKKTYKEMSEDEFKEVCEYLKDNEKG